MLDRRKAFNVVKKLVGNRGSLRALTTMFLGDKNKEYVVSAGCDRHVRVFDPDCEMQKESEVGHTYVK